MVVPIIIAIVNARSASINIILIGARYLIAGNTVVYYSNIEKAKLGRAKKIFTITTEQGRTPEIKADNFPTNARKPDKIQKNKTAKFNKTVEKIEAILKELSPGIMMR